MFETRVPEQAFRVECAIGRLHRHPVARVIEGASGRGTDGGQSQIALLIEQRSTESHGVAAGENDDIEIRESAKLRRRVPTIADGFDFYRRQAQGARALNFQ
jgi:hypothetical protein